MPVSRVPRQAERSSRNGMLAQKKVSRSRLIPAGAGFRGNEPTRPPMRLICKLHVNRWFMRGILSIANARDEHHGTSFG